MAEQSVGYIKVSRFAASTYDEFRKGFNKLSKQGMKKLIVDLRGNGGGYLNAAVDIADEFLSKGCWLFIPREKAVRRKNILQPKKEVLKTANWLS